MKDNLLKSKSYAFAVRVVNLHKHLTAEKGEHVMSKQVLRSGTSVGANVAEGNRGASKADFVHKLSIALKEADETEYWLNLLCDGGFITQKQAQSLLSDLVELQKLLMSSIKTARKNVEAANK
jgi:four helix bundle protein